MLLASEIMRKAGVLLSDEEYVRWTVRELADWVGDGIKATIIAKPSAGSRSTIVPLQRGTLQKVAVGAGYPRAFALLRLVRNLRTNTEPRQGGRVIRMTTRTTLDAGSPLWHDERATPFRDEVRQAFFDEQNPLEWYCYPGNTGKGFVEAVVSAQPAPVAASGGDGTQLSHWQVDCGLDEIYEPVLIDYVCYRAQAKDDTGANAGRSAAHFQQFATALGMKINVEGATGPNPRARVTS